MVTKTLPPTDLSEPEVETARQKSTSSKVQTGVRAIIWNPRKDPTVPPSPNRSEPMRPFVMSYLDRVKTQLTPVSPVNGTAVPQIATFMLEKPGLNWVQCSDWNRAVQEAENYGLPPQDPGLEQSAIERLQMATRQGVDPIQLQIDHGAISVPELRVNNPTGTINDYTLAGIQVILSLEKDIETVRQWQRSVQTSLEAHPNKVQVERLIEKALRNLEGGR